MKLLTLMLLIVACNSPKKADTTPLPEDTVRTKVNKTFTVELSTSMGTGYSWSTSDSAYTKAIRLDSVTVINNVVGKDDGADTQIFHFTALAKNTITLLFIRKRPWEKADKADKEKKFTIIIE
jgi:predicted secreted protein